MTKPTSPYLKLVHDRSVEQVEAGVPIDYVDEDNILEDAQLLPYDFVATWHAGWLTIHTAVGVGYNTPAAAHSAAREAALELGWTPVRWWQPLRWGMRLTIKVKQDYLLSM